MTNDLESFYGKLGDWLKQRFAGWRAYVLTGDARVPKLIGLAPSNTFPSSMAPWNAGSPNFSSSKAEPDAASFRQRKPTAAQSLFLIF